MENVNKVPFLAKRKFIQFILVEEKGAIRSAYSVCFQKHWRFWRNVAIIYPTFPRTADDWVLFVFFSALGMYETGPIMKFKLVCSLENSKLAQKNIQNHHQTCYKVIRHIHNTLFFVLTSWCRGCCAKLCQTSRFSAALVHVYKCIFGRKKLFTNEYLMIPHSIFSASSMIGFHFFHVFSTFAHQRIISGLKCRHKM